MAFCITFGTDEFTNSLKGAENITAQCRNCGNWSARCITRWPWFTVCFVPVLPLATHKYQEVACQICRFHQDIKDRPDVQSMIQNGGQGGGGGGPPPNQGYNQNQYPNQSGNQGWNQGWGQQQQGGPGGGPPKPQYG